MAVLKPTPVSTRQLRWASEHEATADMSDLNGFGQVWDDSCDIGLTLVSHTTGAEVVVAVTNEEVDADGDTRFWTLAPIDSNRHFIVTVFND